MTDRDEENAALEAWAATVIGALGVADLEPDINAVLGLAGRAAHAVMRPAAPLTTFLVGYAAGAAAASSGDSAALGASARSADAVRTATETALRLCRDRATE